MTKLSLEQMIEHSRKSDELYAESLRDEKLFNLAFYVSFTSVVLALVLTVAGLDWAAYLGFGGFVFPFLDMIYLTPRRNKRLRWRKGNDWRGAD